MERGEGINQFPHGEEVNRENDQTNASEDAAAAEMLNSSNIATVGSGPMKRGRGRPKGSKSLKKSDGFINPYQFSPKEISEENQETGDSELVNSLLMRFDAVRRRLSQVKIVGGEATVAIRNFKNHQLYTNRKKRAGSVPGIDVGDIFFLWGEMELVGLHGVPIGTDFMRVEKKGEDKIVAVSVVSSGRNADKGEDPDILTFTGYGSGQEADQKLVRMNLSLKTALEERSDVRVLRAVENERSKIFIYDGIYSITYMWEERSNSGFKIYKFRLVRQPDQKPAFAIWKVVELWKKGLITRPGLVLEDLSFGAENLKVSLVNEVDDEKFPAPFRYVTSLKHPIINIPPMVELCTCPPRACASEDGSCLCVERNGGDSPYVDKVLVTRRSLIYECGGSCHDSTDCKNKVIQTGLKFRLEVFKTMGCGWGLRSWDPIRAGSFICEYAGDLIQYGDREEDDYIFDHLRVYKSFQWNYEPYLVGEDDKEKVPEDINHSTGTVISAKKSGNVARFMNHSCSPNVLWQPIAREENGLWCIYIGFFAMKHIPPLTELRYDYGASRGYGRKKMCLCRSNNCSGSFE